MVTFIRVNALVLGSAIHRISIIEDFCLGELDYVTYIKKLEKLNYFKQERVLLPRFLPWDTEVVCLGG